MKVTIEKIPSGQEESALIRAMEVTESVRLAAGILENGENTLAGYRDGEKVLCAYSKIYYIESVDDKCFVYTKDDCFEVRERLYELEEMLDYRFFRCSKSMICNVKKIRSVKTVANARMQGVLLKGEEIIISRSYIRELKRKLGL